MHAHCWHFLFDRQWHATNIAYQPLVLCFIRELHTCEHFMYHSAVVSGMLFRDVIHYSMIAFFIRLMPCKL